MFKKTILLAFILISTSLTASAWDAGRCPWDDEPFCQQSIYIALPDAGVRDLNLGLTSQKFRNSTRQDKSFPRGNTHLKIVNQAIELLKNDPDSRAIGEALEKENCKVHLEAGLYAIDEKPAVDSQRLGSHFYNAGTKDYLGMDDHCPTFRGGDDAANIGGYAIGALGMLIGKRPEGLCNVANGTARSNAQLYLNKLQKLNRTYSATWFGKLPKNTKPTMKRGIQGQQCVLLGMALHYFTDITQPMHSKGFSGSSTPISTIASKGRYALHPYYENWIGTQNNRPQWQAQPEKWKAIKIEDEADVTLSPNLWKTKKISATNLNRLYKSPDWVLVKSAAESGWFFKPMMSGILKVYSPFKNPANSKAVAAQFKKSLPVLDIVMQAAQRNTASYIYAAIKSTNTTVELHTGAFWTHAK